MCRSVCRSVCVGVCVFSAGTSQPCQWRVSWYRQAHICLQGLILFVSLRCVCVYMWSRVCTCVCVCVCVLYYGGIWTRSEQKPKSIEPRKRGNEYRERKKVNKRERERPRGEEIPQAPSERVVFWGYLWVVRYIRMSNDSHPPLSSRTHTHTQTHAYTHPHTNLNAHTGRHPKIGRASCRERV